MAIYRTRRSGFTIVELLIVIVVVGILASIAIVSFSGIQKNARNTSRITAAQQAVKLLEVYRASNNGNMPPSVSTGSTSRCLTTDNICTIYNGSPIASQPPPINNNTDLMNELKSVGSPPSSLPTQGQTEAYGLYLDNNIYRSFNGKPAPWIMVFWLEGNNVDCKLQNVTAPPTGNGTIGNPQVYVSSTTKYTYSISNEPTDEGITECYVSI